MDALYSYLASHLSLQFLLLVVLVLFAILIGMVLYPRLDARRSPAGIIAGGTLVGCIPVLTLLMAGGFSPGSGSGRPSSETLARITARSSARTPRRSWWSESNPTLITLERKVRAISARSLSHSRRTKA